MGSLYLRCGFCSPTGSVLSLLFPLSLLVTRLQEEALSLRGAVASLQHSSLCIALLLCCPRCPRPLVSGLAAPLCSCCAEILLLMLYCKALASSLG